MQVDEVALYAKIRTARSTAHDTTYGLLGENRSLSNPLHPERVVVLISWSASTPSRRRRELTNTEKEPLEVVGHVGVEMRFERDELKVWLM